MTNYLIYNWDLIDLIDLIFLDFAYQTSEKPKTCDVRAVARSENPGGHVILGGDNVPPWLR